jgi:hypothetical protein
MHDVEGHLTVVQAGHVHSKSLDSDELGGEFGRLSHDNDPALAEAERDALRPACRRHSSNAVSPSLRMATLPAGPLSDRPVHTSFGLPFRSACVLEVSIAHQRVEKSPRVCE